jgi:hypothetical protein
VTIHFNTHYRTATKLIRTSIWVTWWKVCVCSSQPSNIDLSSGGRLIPLCDRRRASFVCLSHSVAAKTQLGSCSPPCALISSLLPTHSTPRFPQPLSCKECRMFPVPVPSIGAMQDVRAPTIQEARRGPSHRARSRRPGHSLRRTRNPHLLLHGATNPRAISKSRKGRKCGGCRGGRTKVLSMAFHGTFTSMP